MNLEQALAASYHHLACRQVGSRRVIVDGGPAFLTIHVQRRSQRRWIPDDDGGSVRYLEGVLRDDVGRYRYLRLFHDLSDIDRIGALLPFCYQALLLSASNDWQPVERGNL